MTHVKTLSTHTIQTVSSRKKVSIEIEKEVTQWVWAGLIDLLPFFLRRSIFCSTISSLSLFCCAVGIFVCGVSQISFWVRNYLALANCRHSDSSRYHRSKITKGNSAVLKNEGLFPCQKAGVNAKVVNFAHSQFQSVSPRLTKNELRNLIFFCRETRKSLLWRLHHSLNKKRGFWRLPKTRLCPNK